MAQDPNAAIGDPIKEMSKVCAKLNYAQQAQFFLNAFWKEHKNDAEHVCPV